MLLNVEADNPSGRSSDGDGVCLCARPCWSGEVPAESSRVARGDEVPF